jgi:hypothetical protein
MDAQITKLTPKNRDKATAASVRKVRGGFIVTYQVPAPHPYAAQQNMASQMGLSAMTYAQEREVVCQDLDHVSNLLAELLGDDS